MATQIIQPQLLEAARAGLVSLREQADALVVKDAEGYTIACQIKLDAQARIKRIGFVLDPGISSAKEHLDFLKNQKAQFLAPAQEIMDIASEKARAWKAEERKGSASEADDINEAAREKARKSHTKAPPPIEVKPNIPVVAGVRRNPPNWRFRVVDATKIPRKYLCPDEVAIGRMVRDLKDKAAAGRECPGIEV